MFQVTIKKDGEVLDELETDFVMASVHLTDGSDAYQNLFYADCENETASRGLRASMENVRDHLSDGIIKAIEEDKSEIEPYDPFDDEGVN